MSNFSPQSKLIYLYLNEVGSAPINQIAKIIGKSVRTSYRYLSELGVCLRKQGDYYSIALSKLSLVVNNLNTTTTDKNTLEQQDKINTILAKYNKEKISGSITRYLPENFDQDAFEYIVKYCIQRQKQKLIRSNFTGYLIRCLENMWDEAINAINKPIETYAPIEPIKTETIRPQPNQEAQLAWNSIQSRLYISDITRKTWFDTAIPIKHTDSILTLSVQSRFAIEQIRKYMPVDKIEFIIES
jgi:hypothetical protein